MTVFILGAGPTGMAIVDGLADNDKEDFVIIEKNNSLGGLAQTIYWRDIGFHDLGPHKIFSTDKELVKRVESLLLKDSWLTRDKISTIYMKGYYLPYPPSPLSLGKVFGINIFIKMCFGYAFAILKNFFKKSNPKTFEDDLINRLGFTIYDVLFRPIANKLWGNPKSLDIKLSQGRIQTPSFFEVLFRTIGFKKTSNFEALDFRYPKGGLSKLWESIENKSFKNGSFLMEHNVKGFTVVDNKITEIICIKDEHETTYELKPEDFVVTSLPLGLTVPLLKKYLPEGTQELLNSVVNLNDLILIFFHVDTKSLIDESWVFVPDPNIIFHRISEQESFDYDMVTKGSIVCCEIMSSEERNMINKSDEELYKLVQEGMIEMGYKNINILDKKIIKLKKSYPVFKTGYEIGLNKLLKRMDKFENFKSVGRQGAFNYIGTLDAMDIGYGFVKWFNHRESSSWEKERNRTNLYPVLD